MSFRIPASAEAALAARGHGASEAPPPDPEQSGEEAPDRPVAPVSSPLATCCFCREPIPSNRVAYRQVRGFERHRQAGGTNAIRLRTATGVWACDECVELRAAGHENQGRLV